jgi:hypothetical protein
LDPPHHALLLTFQKETLALQPHIDVLNITGESEGFPVGFGTFQRDNAQNDIFLFGVRDGFPTRLTFSFNPPSLSLNSTSENPLLFSEGENIGANAWTERADLATGQIVFGGGVGTGGVLLYTPPR